MRKFYSSYRIFHALRGKLNLPTEEEPEAEILKEIKQICSEARKS